MGNKKNIIYLVLGLGLGIIVSNILHSAYPKVEFAELGESEIIERARDLGMVPIKESINIEKGIEGSKDDDLEKTLEKLELALERLEKAEEDEIEETNNEVGSSEVDSLEEGIEVVIESGSNLTDVSNSLYDSGAIEDKDEFAKFVRANNLSKKIVAGNYIIKRDSSNPEIIKLLTGVNPGNN